MLKNTRIEVLKQQLRDIKDAIKNVTHFCVGI